MRVNIVLKPFWSWTNFYKIFLMLLWLQQIVGKARFINIVCNSYDPSFTVFEYCYIKAINRTYQYISLKAKLLQVPVDNATLSFSLTKRANGYRPFLYNFDVDACDFMRNRRNKLLTFLYSVLEEVSNLNHTCPYNHDINVEELSTYRMNALFTEKLPMPRGDYGVHATWLAYNVRRAVISTYVTLS